MSVIEVNQLTKVFKIPKKDPGIGGAAKSLFRPKCESKTAVDHISFKLDAGEIVGYIGVPAAHQHRHVKNTPGDFQSPGNFYIQPRG